MQRVSKESIFSGLNNIRVNTPLSQLSDERFGFTQAEVTALAGYLGRADALGGLKDRYDGYCFGSADIYNPWSVLSFFSEGCVCQPYWTNTSGNAILGRALTSPNEATASRMLKLGLLFAMPGYRDPTSNRESGYGRFDLQVLPKDGASGLPCITLEVKYEHGEKTPEELASLAAAALEQIAARSYDCESTPRIRWGVAFAGKHVAVACKQG